MAAKYALIKASGRRDHSCEQRLRRQHGRRVPQGLCRPRRRHRSRRATTRSRRATVGSDRGDEGRSRRALSRLDAGRRGDDRARLDIGGRRRQIPAQRRHEQPRLHQGGRRAISRRRLRHFLGQSPTPSTDYFNDNYKAFSGGIDPSNPAADRAYDAGAIVGLAIAAAKSEAPLDIRDAIYAVDRSQGRADTRRQGRVRRGARADQGGQGDPLRGRHRPVAFDKYGDITGPFRLWKIADGKVTTVGEMSDRRGQRAQGQDRRIDARRRSGARTRARACSRSAGS